MGGRSCRGAVAAVCGEAEGDGFVLPFFDLFLQGFFVHQCARAAAELVIDVFVAVGELFDGVGGADEVAVDVVAVVGEGFFQRFVLLAQGVAFFLQVFGVVLVGLIIQTRTAPIKKPMAAATMMLGLMVSPVGLWVSVNFRRFWR